MVIKIELKSKLVHIVVRREVDTLSDHYRRKAPLCGARVARGDARNEK